MNAYKVFAVFTLVVIMLGACETTPTPTAFIPSTGGTTSPTIGTVNTIQNQVQAGPVGNLSNVPISQVLYSNDAIYVTDGGAALLNFFDQIALKLFNDTSVDGVNVEILESTNKRIRMKLERGGFSGQVAKDSGGADFEIANGVHVYIMGTQFYLTYDPATDIVSAGNFDGTVGYQVPGQSPQMLPAGSLLDILPGGTVQLFNMPFDINAFEMAAQTGGSPIQGLKDLRGMPATLTPAPTSTVTFTPSPTSCPIPVGWEPVIVQPADTLYTIASRYVTTAEILMQGNCLNTPNLITGTVLYVPPLPVATPCSHPLGWMRYIVQSGENLYQIGLKYGVTVATLQSGNCMGYSSQIYAGQILYVPNVVTITPVGILITGNAGVGYAALSYTDGTAKVAIADALGNYSITISYNWSGTVTPYQTGYTFWPASNYYSNVLANQTGQNYTATVIPYIISGNAGVAGATLSYVDGTTAKTATANEIGAYSFTVPYNWSGTVTPSKADYTFTPANKQYANVLTDQTTQDYMAMPNLYSLTVSKSGTGSGMVTSNPSGINCGSTCNNNFVYNTSVTLTPTAAAGSTFTGWSGACTGTSGICTVTMDAARSVTANFTSITYTISGNTWYANTTITYTGATGFPSGVTTADSNGYYSFTVPAGWTGTVTPSGAPYGFNPSTHPYTNVITNQTQNYIPADG